MSSIAPVCAVDPFLRATEEMVILCFNCGEQHFARDCPEPDKRKGDGPLKGAGKGKGEAGKGDDTKGKGKGPRVDPTRSIYEFPIAEYWRSFGKGKMGKGMETLLPQTRRRERARARTGGKTLLEM